MNRSLAFGVVAVFSLVAVALSGEMSQAVAGHGCHGCHGGRYRARCHGYQSNCCGAYVQPSCAGPVLPAAGCAGPAYGGGYGPAAGYGPGAGYGAPGAGMQGPPPYPGQPGPQNVQPPAPQGQPGQPGTQPPAPQEEPAAQNDALERGFRKVSFIR